MASQQQLAEAHRVEQARLSAETTRAVLALWLSSYEPGNGGAWQALVSALRAMLFGFRRDSSRRAVAYYVDARAAARAPGLYVPPEAPEALPELIEATARLTGARAYTRSRKAGMGETQAQQNAGVQLAGNMARIALDGGRQTILDAVKDDDEAIGWARVTDANPCSFCSMLASRGPAFLSRETASFQAHAHCACVAAAVFSHKEAWLEHSKDLYQQWKRETAGHSGKDALKAWRRYWEGRDQPADA